MRRDLTEMLTTRGTSAVGMTLRSDAELQHDDNGMALIEGHVRSSFKNPDATTASVLRALDGGVVDEDTLFQLAVDAGGDQGAMALQLLLRRLDAGGWLEHVVVQDGAEIARRTPLGHVIPLSTRLVRSTDAVRLSRFALVRRIGQRLVAESPTGAWQVQLAGPLGMAAIAAAVGPVPVDALAETVGTTNATVVHLAQQLLDAGVRELVDAAVDGEVVPEDPPGSARELWSLPDLLFHTRSRVGRHEGGYGGTYRFEGKREPAPAVRTPFEPAIVLPSVDLDIVGKTDPPLAEVMRARRSVRVHDDENPIDAAQLGELLARVARVTSVVHDGHQELSYRQLPSGGALNELEIYPLVNRCEGIEPGLYHYDAQGHTLGLVRERGPRTILLAEYGQRTAVMDSPPQVVFIVTARFDRSMWKYESMAYALSLKHVGVLYEAVYLAATAMGLAVCALGGGNSDAFAAASGIDPYLESSVGELVIGSRPADLADDPWRGGV